MANYYSRMRFIDYRLRGDAYLTIEAERDHMPQEEMEELRRLVYVAREAIRKDREASAGDKPSDEYPEGSRDV